MKKNKTIKSIVKKLDEILFNVKQIQETLEQIRNKITGSTLIERRRKLDLYLYIKMLEGVENRVKKVKWGLKEHYEQEEKSKKK